MQRPNLSSARTGGNFQVVASRDRQSARAPPAFQPSLISGLQKRQESAELDRIDTAILAELSNNARASQVELAERVGLSGTAVARRQKALEEAGFVRGYQAVLDLSKFGLRATVLVPIALDGQSEEALSTFERGVLNLKLHAAKERGASRRQSRSALRPVPPPRCAPDQQRVSCEPPAYGPCPRPETPGAPASACATLHCSGP